MDIVIVIPYPTIYNLNYLILGFKVVRKNIIQSFLKVVKYFFWGHTVHKNRKQNHKIILPFYYKRLILYT